MPGGSPAAPLLAAPINATWAANHGAVWREKGFRGFLFEGLLDDLTPFPSESEAENAATTGNNHLSARPISLRARPAVVEQIVPGDWEALVAELTSAVNRLKAQDVDRNFLRLAIAPEAPYFTDPACRDMAGNRLRLAGAFCQKTGLRGIAIDTQSHNAIYDYRWDGHAPDASVETLREGARQFGRRLLRAFIHAYPDGEILLLAGMPETWGPLWRPFMEGALESVGAAAAIPIRLVLHDAAAPRTPTFYREYAAAIHRLFASALSKNAYERWERQGGIVFSLEPIHYEQDIPTARTPLAAYRRALYAAALYGDDYLMINAPEGGWWHIPPDTAAQFSHLRQSGRATVSFAPPVPRPLDAFAPRLLIAGAAHIGAAAAPDMEAEVLHNDTGAALLVWDGLENELSIPARTGIITATNLTTGEQRYYTPREEQIIVPVLDGLHLIEGLPMRQFALPAALGIRQRTPLRAGITQAEIEFTIQNPLTSPLRASATLNAEDQYAIGAAVVPVVVAPGKFITFRRTIQGISHLGQRPTFSINLQDAADAPINRTRSFPVEPPELYRIVMDGPPLGTPILHHSELGSAPFVVAGDARGGLVCFDAGTARVHWRTRNRGRYTKAPILITSPNATPYIASQSAHGRLRFYDMEGNEQVVVYSDAQGGGMTAVKDAQAPAVLSASVSGPTTVSIHTTAGTLRARIETAGAIRYLTSDPALPGKVFLIAERLNQERLLSESSHDEAESNDANQTRDHPMDYGPDKTGPFPGMLAAYTLDGDLLWETPLRDMPTRGPAIHVPHDRRQAILCTGDSTGAIVCYSAEDGAATARYSSNEGIPIRHITILDILDDGTPLVARADATSLALVAPERDGNAEGEARRWSSPLSLITALTRLPDRSGMLVGLDNGVVYAVGMDGRIRWEDHQGTSAVTGLATYQDTARDNAYVCLVSAQEGVLRALEVRQSLIAASAR